ncbi:MAG: VCBS domain-containing protein [Rhodospirillaceae bacterium]
MPITLHEWVAPDILIQGLSNGTGADSAVAATKSSFESFLIQGGIQSSVASAASDALMLRIIDALAHGNAPETAVKAAGEEMAGVIDHLTKMAALETHHPLEQALAGGDHYTPELVARTLGLDGLSPEAAKAALTAWQSALSGGADMASAREQAMAHAGAAETLGKESAVVLNPGDALAAHLAGGGPEAQSALQSLTKGLPAEQAAALVSSLSHTLAGGGSPANAMHGALDAVRSTREIGLAQDKPISAADHLVAALANGGDVHGALVAAGFTGVMIDSLMQSLANSVGTEAAVGAANDARQAADHMLTASSAGVTGSPIAAALASGGAEATAILASLGGSGGSGGGREAFMHALSEALASGAKIDAALQNAEASASQATAAEAAAAHGDPLLAALANGHNAESVIGAQSGAPGSAAAQAFAAALSQALASGTSLQAAVQSAGGAAAAAATQLAAGSVPISAEMREALAMAGGLESAPTPAGGLASTDPAREAGGQMPGQPGAQIASSLSALSPGANPGPALSPGANPGPALSPGANPGPGPAILSTPVSAALPSLSQILSNAGLGSTSVPPALSPVALNSPSPPTLPSLIISQNLSVTPGPTIIQTVKEAAGPVITPNIVVAASVPTSADLTGRVIDGPIKGARIYVDANRNGVFDNGEYSVISDKNGFFSISAGKIGNAPLRSVGGVDTTSNLSFNGEMTAPAGSTLLTPLTTLIAAIVEKGKGSVTVSKAAQMVATAFDLPAEINLTTHDPFASTSAGSEAGTKTLAAALTVQNTISLIAAAINGTGAASSYHAAVNAVVDSMASRVTANQGVALELSDSTILANVVATAQTTAAREVLNDAGATTLAKQVAKFSLSQAQSVQSVAEHGAVLTDSFYKTIVQVVSDVNTRISTASQQGSDTLLKAGGAVATIAQGSADDALAEAGGFQGSVAKAGSNAATLEVANENLQNSLHYVTGYYTGDNLNNKIDSASVSILENATPTVPKLAPSVVNDKIATDQNTSINISVLGNDIDPNGGTLYLVNLQHRNSAGSFSINGDGTIHYDPHGMFAYLGYGKSKVDSFGYVVDNGSGQTSTGTVSVTITGINDQPTLTASVSNPTYTEQAVPVTLFSAASVDTVDTGQNILNLVLTVAHIGNGADEVITLDGTAVALVNGTSVTTTNGYSTTVSVTGDRATVTLSGAGGISAGNIADMVNSMTYANASDNPTGHATTRTVTLALIQDSGGTEQGGQDTTVLQLASTITITPVNDAPIVTQPTPIALTDTVASDSFATQTGTFIATDADNATLSYSITGGTDNGTTISLTGTYGTLTVTKASGAYTYVPNNGAINALPATTVSDNFTISVSDGELIGSRIMTVNITGVNDTPVVSVGSASAYLIESGGVANAGAGIASSSIVLTKSDSEGVAIYDTAWLTSNGWSTANGGVTYSKTGTYGVAILTVATDTIGYTLSSSSTDPLTGGQSVVDTFTVRVTDGVLTQVASASFNITGANDAAVIGTPTVSTVTEDTAVSDGALTATGTISIADVDTGEGSFLTTVSNSAGALGTLTLATDGSYTYSVSNAVTQYLAAGANHVDSFTVTSADGTTKLVSFTINGVNDAPTMTTVNSLSGATKNVAYTISYATLAAAANEADIDGDTLSFRIEAVTSGSLTKGGTAVTGGSTLLGTGESLVWTPGTDATGTLDAFTIVAFDGAASSVTPVQVQVAVTGSSVPTGGPGSTPGIQVAPTAVGAAGATSSEGYLLSLYPVPYKITLKAGGMYQFDLVSFANAGHTALADPMLGLGTAFVDTMSRSTMRSKPAPLVAMNDDAYGTLNSRFQYSSSAGGDYYIYVSAYADQTSGSGYKLSVTLISDPPLPPVVENCSNPHGETVATLFSEFSQSQVLIEAGYATANEGLWQYSTNHGIDWNSIAFGDAESIALAPEDMLRFLPHQNWNGVPGSLLVGIVNASSGSPMQLESVSTSVLAVNDAPIAHGDVTLAPIADNSTNPVGTTVADLFTQSFSDAVDAVVGGSNADTLAGIAIVGNHANHDQGVWQYSADHGFSWTNLKDGLADNSALILTSSDELRFLPSLHYEGTPGDLTIRLIESGDTRPVTGSMLDLSVHDAVGGHSQFSADTISLFSSVFAVPEVGYDRALGLNGTNHVEIADTTALKPVTALTLETWVQITGAADGGEIISNFSGNSGYRLWFNSESGNLEFDIGNGSDMKSLLSDSASIKDGGWHHLAANYNGSSISLIVDDSRVATLSGIDTNALAASSDTSLLIGRGLTGAINEVSIWSAARSQEQIASDKTHSLNGNESGLAGYWRFDEQSGNIAQNSHPAGPDGTIVGTAKHFSPGDTVEAPLNASVYKGMILGFDPGDHSLSYALANDGAASHGSVEFSGNAFTYTPNSGHISTDDSFTVNVTNANAHMIAHHVEIHPV